VGAERPTYRREGEETEWDRGAVVAVKDEKGAPQSGTHGGVTEWEPTRGDMDHGCNPLYGGSATNSGHGHMARGLGDQRRTERVGRSPVDIGNLLFLNPVSLAKMEQDLHERMFVLEPLGSGSSVTSKSSRWPLACPHYKTYARILSRGAPPTRPSSTYQTVTGVRGTKGGMEVIRGSDYADERSQGIFDALILDMVGTLNRPYYISSLHRLHAISLIDMYYSTEMHHFRLTCVAGEAETGDCSCVDLAWFLSTSACLSRGT